MYFGETEPGIKSAILCVLVLHAVFHLFCQSLSSSLRESDKLESTHACGIHFLQWHVKLRTIGDCSVNTCCIDIQKYRDQRYGLFCLPQHYSWTVNVDIINNIQFCKSCQFLCLVPSKEASLFLRYTSIPRESFYENLRVHYYDGWILSQTGSDFDGPRYTLYPELSWFPPAPPP